MIIFVLSKDAFVSAEQWFTTAGDFALWRGHLSTSKDIFGHHNWGSVSAIQWVGSRKVATHSAMHSVRKGLTEKSQS